MIPDPFHDVRDGSLPNAVSVLVTFGVVGILTSGLAAGVVVGTGFDTGPSPESTLLAQESVPICGQSAQPLITRYNDNIDEVPWFLSMAVRDKEIHGVLHDDTQGNYTFVTGSDGTIQSHAAGTPASPSVRVVTDCETFTSISSAEDPVSVFWAGYRNDRIEIVGFGAVNWLLIEVLKHPYLAGGISLLTLLLGGSLAYYYVRRRQMLRGSPPTGDGDPE